MIAKALTEAIAVSGPPGDTARFPRRSEQYWLQAFSTSDVTAEQMRHFLASFQFIREKWDYAEAADIVNELIGKQDFDPLSDIEAMAGALRVVTERRTPQTVAATAICVFAKPSAKVFVMGDPQCYSARLSLWDRSGRAIPPLLGVPFHDDGWEANGRHGTEDYQTYAQACEAVLEGVVASEAFKKALNRYSDYLESVQGPMRSREQVPIEFVERRLLEKLMACEGWYIRYWLENEAQTGKLSPSDAGMMVSRVVSRRAQDVFPRELAEKFGY